MFILGLFEVVIVGNIFFLFKVEEYLFDVIRRVFVIFFKEFVVFRIERSVLFFEGIIVLGSNFFLE